MNEAEATTGENQCSVHWGILMLGLFVPLAGLMLEVVEQDRIAFRFSPDQAFPHVCLSRVLFDAGCPACGLTRSVVHIMHGRWNESLAVHRLGWLVLAVLVMQIPYRFYRLRYRQKPIKDRPSLSRSSDSRPGFRREGTLWTALILLLFVDYVIRIALG